MNISVEKLEVSNYEYLFSFFLMKCECKNIRFHLFRVLHLQFSQ